MIELHPKFLTENGQKFAILPYDEFLRFQEILEDLDDLQAIPEEKVFSYDWVERKQNQSSNHWEAVINQIGKKDKIEQQEKIKQLFDSWDNLDDEQEQIETLKIIESLETISI
jgi:hypothetical protein